MEEEPWPGSQSLCNFGQPLASISCFLGVSVSAVTEPVCSLRAKFGLRL